jgi:hypothetical protein
LVVAVVEHVALEKMVMVAVLVEAQAEGTEPQPL